MFPKNKRKITKAIIPVAGNGTRFLPFTKTVPKEMLPILNKPTIDYIVDEAIASGIEEIIFITSSTKTAIIDYYDRNFELERNLESKGKDFLLNEIKNSPKKASFYWIRQYEALGLGHAVLQAKNLIGDDETFALLLGDDVIYNEDDKKSVPALKQLINVWEKVNMSVIGVQEVPDDKVKNYGIVNLGDKIDENTWKVKSVIEKPSLKDAPSNKAIIGRYLLNSKIFDYLEEKNVDVETKEIQITDSILKLSKEQGVVATNLVGTRYDMGSILGFVKAQLDYSLRDEEIRDEVINLIKNLKI